MTPTRTISESFWAKVAKGDPDDCWIWQASQRSNGYGNFRKYRAHRWAYEEAKGPIPEGLVIDHLCHRPLCVNPAHLEAVTQSENLRRGYTGPIAAARMKEWARQQTHCRNGHEWTPQNTFMTRDRGRRCRACVRNAELRRQTAKRPTP